MENLYRGGCSTGEGKLMSEKWYHGTSVKNGRKIVENGWLRPGMPTKYVDTLRPRSDAVYITTDYKAARDYARKTDGDGMVIEVQIDDLSKLIPDEDAINIALSMFSIKTPRYQYLGELEAEIQTAAEEMAAKKGVPLLSGPSEDSWDEQAKEVTEYIYKNRQDLSRKIVQQSSDAAYL